MLDPCEIVVYIQHVQYDIQDITAMYMYGLLCCK